MASAQLAQFYKEETIQVAFGTSKLLCYEGFDQAIVDFDLNKGSFSFIDRDDLKLGTENRLSALADYFVLSGSVYSFDVQEMPGGNKELLKQIDEQSNGKPPNPAMNLGVQKELKSMLFEQPIVLGKDLRLQSLNSNQPPKLGFGLKFNDQVYYSMA